MSLLMTAPCANRSKHVWVIVAPIGVVYVGLHSDEAEAWHIYLGWPHVDEITEAKAKGYYAAPATCYWKPRSINKTPGNG